MKTRQPQRSASVSPPAPAPAEQAAALIMRYFAREDVGPMWVRLQRTAAQVPLTKELLRRAQRCHEIDQWRRVHRARPGHDRPGVILDPLDWHSGVGQGDDGENLQRAHPSLVQPAPAPRACPDDFLAVLFGMLDARERVVAQRTFIERQTLRSTGELIGVGEARVCQIARLVRAKLRAEVLRRWPQLAEERAP